jgi:two-component system response regulator MprA
VNEPHRVMIIDDDRGVREILTLAFEGEGYEVRSAADGAEGLEMLARHAADVVIVDMRMPEVDGRQFCERYARMPTGGGPVILMTAMSGRAGTADMPGVVETIAKPFDLDEVLDVVASLVSVSP